ncbi:MAG: hypothetical protein ACREFP_10760 [Acetobacteraceae bacterium]
MNAIRTRLTVAPDGSISTATPLPAGEHQATITVTEPRSCYPGRPFTMRDFPIHDEPWDDSISLHREDLYDDEGRLR